MGHVLRNPYGHGTEVAREVRLQAADMLESLSSRLAAERKDAERWRYWLNDEGSWDTLGGELIWWGTSLAFSEPKDEVKAALNAYTDAAILAAIAESTK